MSEEEYNTLKSFFKEVEEKINKIHAKYNLDIKLEECPTSESYTIYRIKAVKKAEVIYE